MAAGGDEMNEEEETMQRMVETLKWIVRRLGDLAGSVTTTM
jgi:hypothetical protein